MNYKFVYFKKFLYIMNAIIFWSESFTFFCNEKWQTDRREGQAFIAFAYRKWKKIIVRSCVLGELEHSLARCTIIALARHNDAPFSLWYFDSRAKKKRRRRSDGSSCFQDALSLSLLSPYLNLTVSRTRCLRHLRPGHTRRKRWPFFSLRLNFSRWK